MNELFGDYEGMEEWHSWGIDYEGEASMIPGVGGSFIYPGIDDFDASWTSQPFGSGSIGREASSLDGFAGYDLRGFSEPNRHHRTESLRHNETIPHTQDAWSTHVALPLTIHRHASARVGHPSTSAALSPPMPRLSSEWSPEYQLPEATCVAADPSASANLSYAPAEAHWSKAHVRSDPPLTDYGNGLMPRRRTRRSDDDEYTASWIRGDGNDRAGWCGICRSWHKLKNSAYWYHMHYFHGISCVTGKPFDKPLSWRQAQGSTGWEALCGGCNQWVSVGRADRATTPYYRHAYRCQIKDNPALTRSQSLAKSRSPGR
ncbi:Hypothetical predicted protein [Lecanosticta acicola]|uniref:Transcription regulator Rua1 C-terminal domain-containing protein n=1 Tax=Lecanosticta acicola TaxID=111012 RepID=A0AAI8Z7H6_9PEZI|nr:Hypothetical predicted protein [Lecanosticta acicola]